MGIRRGEMGRRHCGRRAGAGLGLLLCAYSADYDRPCFATSTGTDADRNEAAAYAAEWSRRGQDFIVRHHGGVPRGLVRPSPADGQIIATACGGELRWGPRPRYYCVYHAGKNEACYQAAGGTGADQARATDEAVRRSRAAYGRQYLIREHDGDRVRTVGIALRGQLAPAADTTVPEMG